MSAAIQLLDNRNDEPMMFDGVSVQGSITGCLAKTSLQQHYCNRGTEAIELVYEFPLPQQGVLLALAITVGEKVLHGVVSAKAAAEQRYEEAVMDGNGAFLLRELDAGLYQINIGNLLPGERCTIAIDYAEILETADDALRYRLPTVIAPHYGNPASAGIVPQDAPETGWKADYGMQICIRVATPGNEQLLASSPTHPLQQRDEEGCTVFEFANSSPNRMDRDFVLLISNRQQNALTLWQQTDGDQLAVLGVLNTTANSDVDTDNASGMHVTLVVDCSGSMLGDSISQARRAVLDIITRMQEQDSLSILRFGSTQDLWTKEPVRMTEAARKTMAKRVRELQADLGGTELLAALKMAVAITPVRGQILLITDGESYVDDSALAKLAKAGRRFFTVGVGSSVSEKVVRDLATQSGGYCELVTPNENMTGRIVQQVYRMRQPMASLALAFGGVTPVSTNFPGQVFLGDTVLFSAVLPAVPQEAIVARLTGSKQQTLLELSALPVRPSAAFGQDLPRIVAWRQLASLDEASATDLAVKHQLVTEWTSMTAVLERAADEQTDGLPARVKIEQMHAAGWGGMGLAINVCEDIPYNFLPDVNYLHSSKSISAMKSVAADDISYLDIPAFLRREQISEDTEKFSADQFAPIAHALAPLAFLQCLDQHKTLLSKLKSQWKGQAVHEQIEQLLREQGAKLPAGVQEKLAQLMTETLPDCTGKARKDVLYAALVAFLLQDVMQAGFREFRAVRQLLRQCQDRQLLLEKVLPVFARALAGTSRDRWVVDGRERE